jgi:hypothetical protein
VEDEGWRPTAETKLVLSVDQLFLAGIFFRMGDGGLSMEVLVARTNMVLPKGIIP